MVDKSKIRKAAPDRVSVTIHQVSGVWPIRKVPDTGRGRLCVELKYGDQKARTKFWPRFRAGCPTWNQQIDFILEAGRNIIEIAVMEKFVFRHKCHGVVMLQVNELPNYKKRKVDVKRLNPKKIEKKQSHTLGFLGISAGVWKDTPAPRKLVFGDDYEWPKITHKARKFQLKKFLQGSECERYVKLLTEQGFNDYGAFAYITDDILKDQLHIYHRSHRQYLMKLALKERQLINDEVERRKTVAKVDPSKLISVDGKHYYPNMKQLLEGWTDLQTRTVPTLAEEIEADRIARLQLKKEAKHEKLSTEEQKREIELQNYHADAAYCRVQEAWTTEIRHTFKQAHELDDDSDDAGSVQLAEHENFESEASDSNEPDRLFVRSSASIAASSGELSHTNEDPDIVDLEQNMVDLEVEKKYDASRQSTEEEFEVPTPSPASSSLENSVQEGSSTLGNGVPTQDELELEHEELPHSLPVASEVIIRDKPLLEKLVELVELNDLKGALKVAATLSPSMVSYGFSVAAMKQQIEIARLLLPFSSFQDIKRVYVTASGKGYLSIVELCQEYVGVDTIHKALLAAASKDQLEIVKKLFPLRPEHQDQSTALLAAVVRQHLRIVSYLAPLVHEEARNHVIKYAQEAGCVPSALKLVSTARKTSGQSAVSSK